MRTYTQAETAKYWQGNGWSGLKLAIIMHRDSVRYRRKHHQLWEQLIINRYTKERVNEVNNISWNYPSPKVRRQA